jgi:[NiFe] hydrogenase diaphorase moiety small subunit
MKNVMKFTIDGKECMAERGQTILSAAKEEGIYIPTLCYYPGNMPRGGCRICTVRVNDRLMNACTTPVANGMIIENDTERINELRKSIIELLFVEGNHFCPSCEKSGNCELQALAYRFKVMAPRFPYQFPLRKVYASPPKIIKEQNRCILCKRCVRTIKDEKGRSLFTYKNRGPRTEVIVDVKLGSQLTDELAQKAMDVCPVGSIIYKGKGFSIPIGKRKYDGKPIGSEINEINVSG